MLTSTTESPSIPPPPTFADFKFSVIGQPPQLLKRMGAIPPFEFQHSPTPMCMDLQYPSRAGTPCTSAVTSQPTLQQRLESTNYSTDSISDGHHPLMEVSAHLTERKAIISAGQPIMSPFQSFNESTSPPSKHTSLHSSLKSHESQVSQASSSNTHTTMAIRLPPLSTMPSSYFETCLASESLSSMSGSEALQSSKPQLPQINLDMKLLYESALIAFEKAQLGLESAQETYSAAKATLTAIATRFPQVLAADVYPQHTSKTLASGSPTTTRLGDPADPVIAEVSRDILETGAVIQERSIQQLNYTTLTAEQRGFCRQITELEQEANDVRMAWSSLSAQRSSTTLASLGTDEYPPSSTPSHMRRSVGTSAGSSPDTQSASAIFVADPTNIVKDEDVIDDHRRPCALGRETSSHDLPSGIPLLIDSNPSHISIDYELGRKSPRAPVLDSSRLDKHVNPTQVTSFLIPTGTQDTTTIVDSSGRHTKGTEAPKSAPRGILHNSIEFDDTAEDDNPADSDHTRSESNPISLGEDISNELEVARELEVDDAGLRSSSTSRDVSRSSSIHPIEKLHNIVDEEVLQTKPSDPSPDLNEEQDIDRDTSTIQGSSSEPYTISVSPSSRGDHRSINESSPSSLLQRLQPVSILISSKTLEPQPESVAGRPSSPPSVLGKRQHFDPSPPGSQPSVIFPPKRRHFNTQRNDPPSLESRISDASAPTNESIQSNTPMSPIHLHKGHISHNKSSYAPRNKHILSVERSMSPPSGPRASRPENVQSKHSSAASSRPISVNYRPPVGRQLGVGSDCYPNKCKGKGPRKRYVRDGAIPTSGYDKTSGTGRGGMRQNHVTCSQNWDSSSRTDSTGFRRTDARTRFSPSECRGSEQISLADRLRDP